MPAWLSLTTYWSIQLGLTGVAIASHNEVVLVRLYRHGMQQTVLEIPSGGVEASDISVLAAARRELLEETGYGGGMFVETGRLSPNSANHANTVHCFLATEIEQILSHCSLNLSAYSASIIT